MVESPPRTRRCHAKIQVDQRNRSVVISKRKLSADDRFSGLETLRLLRATIKENSLGRRPQIDFSQHPRRLQQTWQYLWNNREPYLLPTRRFTQSRQGSLRTTRTEPRNTGNPKLLVIAFPDLENETSFETMTENHRKPKCVQEALKRHSTDHNHSLTHSLTTTTTITFYFATILSTNSNHSVFCLPPFRYQVEKYSSTSSGCSVVNNNNNNNNKRWWVSKPTRLVYAHFYFLDQIGPASYSQRIKF